MSQSLHALHAPLIILCCYPEDDGWFAGEMECWKKKGQDVLTALAQKEKVIKVLLDRVHLLERAGPEGTGGMCVSEYLMNHNQKLESTISWLEVRGRGWR